MKRLIHTLLPALLATSPLLALAESGRLLEVQVERRDGSDYPEFKHRQQAWVAGEQGEPYQVKLTNRSNERLLVVLSVDGVNAVDGQTAGYGQAGYVLGPRQTTTVTGWRKSLGSVARFEFTDLPDSYAARTDRPDDVGVIGVAAFRERRWAPPPVLSARPRAQREKGAADSAAGAPPMESGAERAAPQALGTGHGGIEYAPVSQTRFNRESSQPNEVLTIRYDSPRNLRLAGVIPDRRRHYDGPAAFPRETFVPDPPYWR